MGTPLGYVLYDGALISVQSDLGKELIKWEKKPDWTPEANPFPKMMYKAQNRPDGRRSVHEVLDSVCGGQPGSAEQFSRRCQITVKDDYERQRAYEQGYRNTPQEALERLEAKENTVAALTAERHFADARMSPQAQAEANVADHTTLRHLPEIPEQPKKRRGRPPKAKVAYPEIPDGGA